jgi:hypothetical protein
MELKIEKIPSEKKTELVNSWKALFPELKRVGASKLQKIVGALVVGIEIIYDRDNKGYVPYISIYSLLDPRASHLSTVILSQAKYDTGKTIHVHFEKPDSQEVILSRAAKDFNILSSENISIDNLLNYMLTMLADRRIIFGYQLNLYSAIIYLYSISDCSEEEKKWKYSYLLEEISKSEEAHRRLYKESYDEHIADLGKYFSEPGVIAERIDETIKNCKLDKLNRVELIRS